MAARRSVDASRTPGPTSVCPPRRIGIRAAAADAVSSRSHGSATRSGEQQVRGEAVLGGGPVPLVGPDPVGEKDPAVDHRRHRAAGEMAPERRRAVTIEDAPSTTPGGGPERPVPPSPGRRPRGGTHTHALRPMRGRAPRRAVRARPASPPMCDRRRVVRRAVGGDGRTAAQPRRARVDVGRRRPRRDRRGRGRAGRRCRTRAAIAAGGRRPGSPRPPRASGGVRCRRAGRDRWAASRSGDRDDVGRIPVVGERPRSSLRPAAATNARRSRLSPAGRPPSRARPTRPPTSASSISSRRRAPNGASSDGPATIRRHRRRRAANPVAMAPASARDLGHPALSGPRPDRVPGGGFGRRPARIARSLAGGTVEDSCVRTVASAHTSASVRTSAMPRRPWPRRSAALAALPGMRLRGVSRLYATEPVGVTDQPEFRNAVVALDVPAGPDPATGAIDLLATLKGLERPFGRRRRGRWGPRELDLDLLVFGQRQHRDRAPARGAFDRRRERPSEGREGRSRSRIAAPAARLFVLAPLADLAPRLVPPGWGGRWRRRRRRAGDEGSDAVRPIGGWDANRRSWLSGR